MHRLLLNHLKHVTVRTVVFWTLRLCVDVFPGPPGLVHILTL